MRFCLLFTGTHATRHLTALATDREQVLGRVSRGWLHRDIASTLPISSFPDLPVPHVTNAVPAPG
jgi:FixJ family two-component response regulator